MIKVQHSVSLKPYNTFGVEAIAKQFVEITSTEELAEALGSLAPKTPLLILGGGSNLLFTRNFDGLVLKNSIKGISVVKENDTYVWIKAMGGENWHQFVLHCIKNNWAGIENLSLIPGTTGAAPMQNIGAYGVEIKDVFESLEAMELASGEMHVFDKKDCQFGYRESIFKKKVKNKYIITSVTLKLNKKPSFNTSYGAIRQTLESMGIQELSIKAISDAVIYIRQTKLPDPAQIGNAGSFFKNPVIDKIDYEGLRAEFSNIPGYKLSENLIKIPAAWLIENTGWKGKTFGAIGVHKNQPLVLVNYGEGNGNDIKNLSLQIRESVETKFGIQLTPEVNII